MDLSKIESGNFALAVEVGNLSEVLGKNLASFEHAINEKDIQITKNIVDSGKVWFDSYWLETICYNLMANAIKYIDERKLIEVSYSQTEKLGCLSIKNTHSRVEREELEQWFNRFYRADNHTVGTGIGLSLVQELVNLYSASITVAYTQEGFIGFELVFPILKSSFNASQLGTRKYKAPEIQVEENQTFPLGEEKNKEALKPTVLVIEDHHEMRSFIASLFGDGYTVHTAEDGIQGIRKAEEMIPDIVISDIMMPGLDGVSLCGQLKSGKLTSHIPVILLTAKSGNENEIKGLESQADDYLTKPFNTEVLQLKVKNLLQQAHKLQQKFSQELEIKPLELVFPSSEEMFARNLQQVINEHLGNPDFNVELFCKAMGLSRTQLHRKLTALTGLSATAFMRTQRVKIAAGLLRSEDANISEICYQVGFSDTSYFSKCFKEIMGKSPKEYMLQIPDNQEVKHM
jgi:DNA-binding response OmpR family regulator